MRDVRRALDEDHPLGLLGLASSMLAALDPHRRDLFNREPDPDVPSRDELMQTFMEVDHYEPSALMTAMAELAGDGVARARARREVAGRGHALPAWLDGLHTARADRAVELVRDIDPADARVRISEAVELSAITFPPCESDSWPACRPLVEWVARLLPEGGAGYQRPDWDAKALRALTERFLGSPFGAGFDDGDHRGLLESLLWFGTSYGPGDPLRWSPVAVEILLADWLPRKILADAPYLAKAPALLRAFIRFCHHERGIRAELTAQTLDTVEEHEPTYQRAIRSPRPQGPAALFAAMGALDPGGPWSMPPTTTGASQRSASTRCAAPSAATPSTGSTTRRCPTSPSPGTPSRPTSAPGWPRCSGWSTGAATSSSTSSTARPAAASSPAPQPVTRRCSPPGQARDGRRRGLLDHRQGQRAVLPRGRRPGGQGHDEPLRALWQPAAGRHPAARHPPKPSRTGIQGRMCPEIPVREQGVHPGSSDWHGLLRRTRASMKLPWLKVSWQAGWHG